MVGGVMARANRRLPENVPGEFYVDDTCIDCDACRQIAPATFRDHGGQSSVYRQPGPEDAVRRAMMAIVACPTASIGTTTRRNVRAAALVFPERIVGDVHFCGYTAEASFGAWSYLVVRPPNEGGNVLVDSPRFTAPLIRRIEEMGGVNLMYLSHRDDIADHKKFAAHFRCPRIMHEADGASRLGIEWITTSLAPTKVARDLLSVPTPGHTRGHQVLLYRSQVVFSGDHLAWSPTQGRLVAFRDVCWYSWSEQTRSMQQLLDYDFEWVLPGHGRIGHTTRAEMHGYLERCVDWMKRVA